MKLLSQIMLFIIEDNFMFSYKLESMLEEYGDYTKKKDKEKVIKNSAFLF